MARVQSFAIIVIFCLTILKSLAVAQVDDDYEVSAPDGSYTLSTESFEDPAPPLPETEPHVGSEGMESYLEYCSSKLSNLWCGQQIVYDAVSDAETNTLSMDCCIELLNIGYSCHRAVIVTLLRLPEYQPLAAKILPKSDVTWIRCNQDVAAVAGPAGSPLPSDEVDVAF